MYSLLSIRELRRELRRRNASVAGKKAALIERLEAYDRNQDFGINLDVEEDRTYTCPASETYKDVNADSPIPNISKYEIQEYFQRLKTSPKGQLLYESRHLVTARYSSVGTFTYLRGLCKATMKKVAYVVDAKVNFDGSIEECHCECAAGSGTTASCKHVAVLLLAAHDIVNTKSIKLHQACTQQLMTFKKPKKVFYNSPIAAQNMPNKRLKSCNYEPLRECNIMSNYENYVRNLAIGYGDTSMPILQTYEPANPYAIEWDHSYSVKSQEDLLLESLFLKNIDDMKIRSIEEATQMQYASPLWHEMRSCRITASLFHAVCHSTSSGKSGLIRKILVPNPIQTRAISHGKIHEPIAIKKYEDNFYLIVQKCGIFICKEYPFLAASPDGLIGEETVVEVKCPYVSRHKLINEVTVPYIENVNGEYRLKKDHPYYCQVQGQLYCTKRKYCNFIIYTFEDMKVLFITLDEAFINEMLTSLINFYVHYLEPAVLDKYIYKNYLNLIKPHY